jgi:hypothetical protein
VWPEGVGKFGVLLKLRGFERLEAVLISLLEDF